MSRHPSRAKRQANYEAKLETARQRQAAPVQPPPPSATPAPTTPAPAIATDAQVDARSLSAEDFRARLASLGFGTSPLHVAEPPPRRPMNPALAAKLEAERVEREKAHATPRSTVGHIDGRRAGVKGVERRLRELGINDYVVASGLRPPSAPLSPEQSAAAQRHVIEALVTAEWTQRPVDTARFDEDARRVYAAMAPDERRRILTDAARARVSDLLAKSAATGRPIDARKLSPLQFAEFQKLRGLRAAASR